MELKRNLVALSERVEPPTACHQIDGLRGAASPHQLGRICRAEELRQLHSCLFEGDGGPSAQLVDTTMHVGVVVLVIRRKGVQHVLGLLRGGSVVQVDERMPADLLGQSRELSPQGRPIESRRRDRHVSSALF